MIVRALLKEGDHMICVARLFRNASSQEAKQNPAENGGDAREQDTPNPHKNNSRQDENAYENKNRGKEKMRRSISHNCGMQAEGDPANKSRGDRYGRQPHSILRNLTRVSMWNVCGNRSNKCISTIS